MKKNLVFGFILILICALLFSGCSSETTTTTATTTATATTTETVKTVSLKFTYLMSNTNSTGKNLDAWAAAVTEQTQGRVEVTTYPSNSLVASDDAYTAVQKGVADIAFGSIGDFPDLWPQNQVFTLPVLKVPLAEKSIPFFKDCMATIPELKNEIDASNVHFLLDYSTGQGTQLHTSKKLVRTPEDAAGLKIVTLGGMLKFVKAFGGSPLGLFPPDFYMALDRGTAEGLMIPYDVLDATGCVELTPYHLALNLNSPRFLVYMNLDVWNDISQEDQAIINQISEQIQLKIIADSVSYNNGVVDKINDLNQTITVPTEAELTLWLDSGQPVTDEYIQNCANLGLPGQEIYDKVVALTEKDK